MACGTTCTTHASTAPAVVPAMNECSGFSFFDILAVLSYRIKYTEKKK